MAKQRKTQALVHCKVVITTHPTAPWRVSYPVEENGVTRRKRRMFSTEQKAMDFAADHEREVSDHGIRFGSITAEARRAFDYYRDASAEEIELPSFETLVMDAVARHRKAHADRQRSRFTVAEAVAAFLAYKKTRTGTRHYNALSGELGRFAEEFGTDRTDAITAAQIEEWLTALPGLAAATRNKLRTSLKSLFSYGCAKAQGWCDHNPLASIGKERIIRKIPKCYTPDETTRIMQAALFMKSPALPELALGLFAGMRPSEILSLDLESIDIDADEFRTPAHHADGQPTKTGPRSAPLTDACKAWLRAQDRRKGKAWTGSNQDLSTELRAIHTAAKVTPIPDGRRHSFISYRCAEIRDVAQVADECGNSPGVIKTNYRNIVSAAAAEKYFAIRPEEKAENVTDIMEGRAIA